DLPAVVGALDRVGDVEPARACGRCRLARRPSGPRLGDGRRGDRRSLSARRPGGGSGSGVRARGASRRRVLAIHAFPAAAGPVITLAGLQLPVLVSGALVVEVVFGWPG